MKKPKRNQDFVRTPTYPGGTKALKEFIAKNKRYPKAAIQNKIEGGVFVKYSVNHKGDVIDAKVVDGLGHGCDEEALRLVNMLKFEKVKNRGVNVTSHFKITIRFRLKDVKTATISYSVTSKPKEQKSPTYNYTIRLPDQK